MCHLSRSGPVRRLVPCLSAASKLDNYTFFPGRRPMHLGNMLEVGEGTKLRIASSTAAINVVSGTANALLDRLHDFGIGTDPVVAAFVPRHRPMPKDNALQPISFGFHDLECRLIGVELFLKIFL
jgi:hypothetical protein